MSEKIERLTTYIIGGLAGISTFLTLCTSGMITLPPEVVDLAKVISITIGVLISMFIFEIKKTQKLTKNEQLRNETIALITHEMKTGLTGNGWILEILLEKYGAYFEQEDKMLVKNSIDSVHTTVMHSVNLLDISLLDINKLTISLEKMQLDKVEEMFKETMEKYTLGSKRSGINLTSKIVLDKEKFAEVDLVRLRIVVENLLENAIQYSKGDKKEIDVEIVNSEKHLKIKVKDNGMGIPKGEQKKIFSEFYRASNARTHLSTGSGIGLYMTKKYVKAHNGEIHFESTEGVGTTFFIEIPLKTSEDVNKFLKQI